MKLATNTPVTLFDLVMHKLNLGSKSKGKQIIKYSTILINGKKCNDPRTLINPGDEVILEREKAPMRKEKTPFPIHYEDRDLLITEKPAGILTHSTEREQLRSLYGTLSEFIKFSSNGKERIYPVHRLDREVTGLLIFAKSEEVRDMLRDNWDSVEKLYYALVENAPEKKSGTIESWLYEDPKSLKVYSVNDGRDAKWAVTHYRVLKQIGTFCLLEVKLETGRKNQIRVHLSDIGCPIVGDYRYGARPAIKRQVRLCAYSLRFPHPKTGKEISVEIKPKKSFFSPGKEDEKYK